MPDGYRPLNWANVSLINSYSSHISLLDSASREVDRTLDAKDDKNNNLCGARYPNGKDLNSDLDWNLQEATPRTSNRGSSVDIYAGKSMCLLFNLIWGSIELELCIACVWPKGTEHPQGHSGIHPVKLLLLSSSLGLTTLPGDQPALRTRGKNCHSKASRPASRPGCG